MWGISAIAIKQIDLHKKRQQFRENSILFNGNFEQICLLEWEKGRAISFNEKFIKNQ